MDDAEILAWQAGVAAHDTRSPLIGTLLTLNTWTKAYGSPEVLEARWKLGYDSFAYWFRRGWSDAQATRQT